MGLFGRKKQNTENMPETVEKAVAEVSAESTNPGDMSLGGDRMVCRHQLDHALSGDGQGVVMKFYIENFKRMNELFGFSYCEELLKAILEYLREKTGCTVYRYVGVEFIAILRSRTQGQAVRLAEEILDRFSQSWKIDGTDCMCSCQIGLCSYPGYASSADEILKYLDLAVSKAAETGINQYAIYDSKLHAMYLRKQAIARYISTALENHELEIRFRPTYNTKENRFVRAEYYMRMFVKDIGHGGKRGVCSHRGGYRPDQQRGILRAGACSSGDCGAGEKGHCVRVHCSSGIAGADHSGEFCRYCSAHD